MLAATAFRPPPIAASLSLASCKVAARPGLFTPSAFRGSLLRRVPASFALSKGATHQRKRGSHAAATTGALTDGAGRYPLHAVALTAPTAELAEGTIKQLLAAGHSVNQADDSGNCPLHYAANNPSPEGAAAAIRLLVAAGADVAARDARGFQALHWAVAHSKFAFLDPSADFVKSLRRGAVDVGEPFQYGRDGSQVSFVGTLPHPPKNPSPGAAATAIRLVCGFEGSTEDDNGMWPQQLVVWNCYPEAAAAAAVTALLEAGADVDGLAAGGLTALQIAARESEDANVMKAVIPLLLGAGADVNKQVVCGGQPLHCAVLNEDPDAAQVAISLLVSGGADINAGDKDGKQPLHFAAECHSFYRGSSSAHVPALLAHGANVNAQGQSGQTPLHYAALNCSFDDIEDCIHALVAAGADVNALDDNNQCPLGIALQNRTPPDGRYDVGAALWEAGARYYGFDDDTQKFVGPESLAEFAGTA